MELYNFDEKEKRLLEEAKELKKSQDKHDAEKEYNKTQDLEIALSLYEKFISDIYPKIVTKCLDRYYTVIAMGSKEGSLEEDVDNIEFDERVYLDRRIGGLDSIEFDELLMNIKLECNKYFDTYPETFFIEMLTNFLRRNGCNIDESYYNNRRTIYIHEKYKHLKDAYYMEMQALEYRREALDESKNYREPKGRN